jgi:hypothetical protein
VEHHLSPAYGVARPPAKPSAYYLIGVLGAYPRLKEAGIAVVMRPDDNRRTAEVVAHDWGLECVFAEVRPE